MFLKIPAMKKLFFPLLFILTTLVAKAQKNDSTKWKPQFKISVNYNSGLNYYGRTDSLKSKAIFPLAEIWLGNKFYMNAAPIFVYNDQQSLQYAGSVGALGFLNVTHKWITNIYVLKPFYKESSQLVQAALKAQAGISLTYLNKVLNLTAGGDMKYSDKLDFGATAGVDHIFRIQNKDNSVIVIDPSFTINAGGQQFSRTYSRKLGGLFPRQQEVTENVQAFNLLSMEATMPLIYNKGKLQFIATPAYVMPKNLLKVAGRPDLSENGEDMFYMTLTAKYRF